MTADQYERICASCRALLVSADATTERVAIPWLHVIRDHPVFLEHYESLIRPSRFWWSWREALSRKARQAAGWGRQVVKALRDPGVLWHGPPGRHASVDVLFVSHLLNASQAGQREDFYFGRIPEDLRAAGFTAAVALINQAAVPAGPIAAAWFGSGTPRFVFSSSLGPADEMRIFSRLWKAAARLRAIAASASGLEKAVARRAASEALSGGARATLRIDQQVASLVATLKPKAIVVTHEGHAWERIAFAAARRSAPQIVCVGYQHAAVFPRQFAIRQTLASPFNPDRILTAGRVALDQLREAPGLQEIPMAILGSSRGLRRSGPPPRESPCACLVIPEGLPGECVLLFSYALACARLLPDVRFVWRLHPVMSFEWLLARNPEFSALPDNVTLSKATFDEDLASCHWALYRGTTAVVQCVGAGVRPVYLRRPGEMTIDPLEALARWRLIVETPDDLASAFARGPEADRDAEAEAIDYCERFFSPFDYTVLVAALGGGGRPSEAGIS